MTRPARCLQAVLPVVLLASLSACSAFPRLVVLHDPLTPQEHVTLGESYQGQGQTDLAVREFQAALRQQSDYVPALVAMGNVAFEAGTLEDAEQSYRQALAALPNHAAANNNLAMVYLSRGDRLDEAERLAKNALAQGGALQPYALDTLARIYMRQQRYQDAALALRQAVAAVPEENTILRERLAQSQRELSDASPALTKP
jgi:tetratricopeptide (TPR) repeat protein